jgi:hypothetical protein
LASWEASSLPIADEATRGAQQALREYLGQGSDGAKDTCKFVCGRMSFLPGVT